METIFVSGQNELDAKAMGGTELLGLGLERNIDPVLLSKFQIIRSRVRDIDPNKIPILWLHDLPDDPESQHLRDPASRARFKKIVFVSNWQAQQYHDKLGIPFDEKVHVIRNAIDPIPEGIKPTDKIKLVYHSTPHRGLNILYAVFDALSKKHPNIELDVFSSFKLYGWEERDAPFQELFDLLRAHPRINYHGTQSQEVVRKALSEAHIFAYPSTWLETSCCCAIEAMSAKTLLVVPNYGALPETATGMAMMYQWDEDVQRHANAFYAQLDSIITNIRHPSIESHVLAQKRYADYVHGWATISVHWKALLDSTLPS